MPISGLNTAPAVANLIRESKTVQIASIMQTGKAVGMVPLNDALFELVKKGTVVVAAVAASVASVATSIYNAISIASAGTGSASGSDADNSSVNVADDPTGTSDVGDN